VNGFTAMHLPYEEKMKMKEASYSLKLLESRGLLVKKMLNWEFLISGRGGTLTQIKHFKMLNELHAPGIDHSKLRTGLLTEH